MKKATHIKTGNTHNGIVKLDTREKNEKLPKGTPGKLKPDIKVDWKKIAELVNHKGDKQSGFFDLAEQVVCRHHEHNPPMHLYIPPGKGYLHVCPGCGREITLMPSVHHLG